MTSSSVRGRICSASGACAGAVANRTLADNVGSRGGAEAEQAIRQWRVDFEFAQAQHGDLTERVMNLHAYRPVAGQPDLDALEARVAPPGAGLDELEAIGAAGILEVEVLVEILSREQRGGAGSERRPDPLDGHLVEVRIVTPEAGAIADQQLLVGLLVGPTELAGSLQGENPGRLLRLATGFRDNCLGEGTARTATGLEEAPQLIKPGGLGRCQWGTGAEGTCKSNK